MRGTFFDDRSAKKAKPDSTGRIHQVGTNYDQYITGTWYTLTVLISRIPGIYYTVSDTYRTKSREGSASVFSFRDQTTSVLGCLCFHSGRGVLFFILILLIVNTTDYDEVHAHIYYSCYINDRIHSTYPAARGFD